MADDKAPIAHRSVTQSRIKVFDRADGSKEFVAPAMRNFQEKKGFIIVLLILAAGFVIFVFVVGSFIRDLPFAWARFLAVNFFFFHFAVLTLMLALIGFICVDMWLRSTRHPRRIADCNALAVNPANHCSSCFKNHRNDCGQQYNCGRHLLL